ncbi:MAG: glycosyltransferase family 4 protein, partial [Proteobacteria bacterium]|nr:glycosyltransferase family 4 protein [Pseudomonadota bacterium]
MPKPRVLHVNNTLRDIGGAEECVVRLAQGLRDRGYEVLVALTDDRGVLAEGLRGVPVRTLYRPRRSVVKLPLFVADVLAVVLRLRRLMRQEGIDVLQTHLPDSDLLALLAGRLAGVPVRLYTFHSTQFMPPRRHTSLRRRLRVLTTRLGAVLATRLVAVSEAIAENMVSLAGLPRDKISIVPNGISPEKFRAGADAEAVRREFGLTDDRPLIVSVGHLHPYKNQAMLIRAAARVRRVVPGATFLIAGEGEMRPALESLRSKLSLDEAVLLPGRRRDVPSLLAAAGAFVLTSRWEGLPVSVLEAMAMARPVVVTRAPGCLEVVQAGRTGLVVDQDDDQALAEALIELLTDPDRAREMGRRGLARVEAEYSLDKNLD